MEKFKGFTGEYTMSTEVAKNHFGAHGIAVEIDGDPTIEVWAGIKPSKESINKAWETAEMIAEGGRLVQEYGGSLSQMYQELLQTRIHLSELKIKLLDATSHETQS